MAREITIALAGNPNSGKSTLFNAITGDRQHVGNYPGVTVEKMEGRCTHKGVEICVVDLPGTYSLTAYSVEELVARNFLVDRRPDVVVDIIDASNVERNLYLAVQLMELGVPLVLAFNMTDVAKLRGMEFDLEQLSTLLGAPIVCTVGHKGKGVTELLDAVVAFASQTDRPHTAAIHYGHEIEDEIAKVQQHLRRDDADHAPGKYAPRWLALKLIEGDLDICKAVASEAALAAAERSRRHLRGVLGDAPEAVIAERRYGFISGACQETVRTTVEARHLLSDQIDRVLTNGIVGLPIFLAMMYMVFQLTFTLGETPMGWIEEFFDWTRQAVSGLWPPGSDSDLRSLLVDGVIGGVGGVIVFLPNIMLLFLAIAFLEDSGYMARAAFLMDRLMHKIGLHGKSFIPMMIGFGCSVPAIMATRTLESRRDRLTTMLVIPLMSCGARFPIYTLIIPAFYPPAWRAPMLGLIYLIGIVLAVVCAKVLRKTLLKGESHPFVMELPPYRMPTARAVAVHMWSRAWLYLRKAGTIILGVSIVMWAMTSYPKKEKTDFDRDYDAQIAQLRQAAEPSDEAIASLEAARQSEELAYSIAGRVGRAMEPAIRPLGFDWKVGTALIGALAAKEVFVAQLGVVYSVGQGESQTGALRERLRDEYGSDRLTPFCIMLFCLISAPCVATIAATKMESGSWRWALLQLGGLTLMAYVITLVVYQVGSLLS